MIPFYKGTGSRGHATSQADRLLMEYAHAYYPDVDDIQVPVAGYHLLIGTGYDW